MSEKERLERIEQLEREIWQREAELSKLRKAGKTKTLGDLFGIAQGMFPHDLTLEEIQSWHITVDDKLFDPEHSR
jgi:hypothetical protein